MLFERYNESPNSVLRKVLPECNKFIETFYSYSNEEDQSFIHSKHINVIVFDLNYCVESKFIIKSLHIFPTLHILIAFCMGVI